MYRTRSGVAGKGVAYTMEGVALIPGRKEAWHHLFVSDNRSYVFRGGRGHIFTFTFAFVFLWDIIVVSVSVLLLQFALQFLLICINWI